MGVERDDAAAAKPRRSGTEPGLGGTPAGSGHSSAAQPHVEDDASDAPEAVDFDALHAALGDPLALDSLPSEIDEHHAFGETSEHEEHEERDEEVPQEDESGFDEEREGEREEEAEEDAQQEEHEDVEEEEQDEEPHSAEHVGESQGRSSAQYASSRPRTIPPSHITIEDMNAPPVIVAGEESVTVPSGPPQQMTAPVHQTRPIAHTPLSGVPFVSAPPPPVVGDARNAHSSGPHPAALPIAAAAVPTYPPEGTYPRNMAQMTVRMPDRPLGPIGNPRRGKIETLVVRPRGPSTKQKLFAFMAMLLLVTACGIAVIIWRKPAWVGLEQATPPAAPTSSVIQVVPLAPMETSSANAMPTNALPTASPSVATSGSATPSASAPKPKPRPMAPATAPNAPSPSH